MQIEPIAATPTPTSTVQGTQQSAPTTGTPQKTEEVKPAESTVKPEDAKLNELANREKILRAKARQTQQKEAELKQREQALRLEGERTVRERIRREPFVVLQEENVSYNDLTKHLLNQPRPEDEKLQKLESELNSLKSQIGDTQQQQYQAAVRQLQRDVDYLIKTSPDEFELVVLNEAQGAVVNLIEETWKEEHRLMSTDEAAKEIEDFLVERARKISQAKKLQAKAQPQASEQTPNEGVAPTKTKPPTKTQQPLRITTLSHGMIENRVHRTTPEERRNRAIAAFNGKL